MKNYLSLKEIQKDISNGRISCKSLVSGYLENIKSHQKLNAFIEVYEKEALERAELIDLKLTNNTAGSLAGLVVGIKDNIYLLGIFTCDN